MKPFCTYITHHTDGWFYIGKGITAKVLDGTYTGSGRKYQAARTKRPDGWTTEVLEMFSSQVEAYYAESALLTRDIYLDEYCLNLHPGNRFMQPESASPERLEAMISMLELVEKLMAAPHAPSEPQKRLTE